MNGQGRPQRFDDHSQVHLCHLVVFVAEFCPLLLDGGDRKNENELHRNTRTGYIIFILVYRDAKE